MAETIIKQVNKNTRKRILSGIFIILLIPVFLWLGEKMVTAQDEAKKIYIFPSQVEAVGWQNGEESMDQDLAPLASYSEFTDSDAAYIFIHGAQPELGLEEVVVNTPLSIEGDSATSTESDVDVDTATTTDEMATSTVEEERSVEDEVIATSTPPALGGDEIENPVEEVMAPENDSADSAQEGGTQDEKETATEEEQSASSTPEVAQVTFIKQITKTVKNWLLPEVFATTTNDLVSTTTEKEVEDSDGSIFTSTSSEAQENDSDGESGDTQEEVFEPIASTTEDGANPDVFEDIISATSSNATSTIDIATSTQDLVSTTTLKTIATTSVATTTEDKEKEVVATTSTETTVEKGIDEPFEQNPIESVSLCEIKGSDCYTMEFTGFGIGDSLADSNIEQMQLNISFASFVERGGDTDSLIVKYYHQGLWHLAGEFSLDGRISNLLNDGYISYLLPEFETWAELDELRVSVEYDRNSTAGTKLFLDGFWLEAAYKEVGVDWFEEENPADEEVLEEENVVAELKQENVFGKSDSLLLDEDEVIDLGYTDENEEETLIIKSDKKIYEGLTESRVYFSVTNISGNSESFRLQALFPEGRGSVKELNKRMRNIPYKTSAVEKGTIGYFCSAGWVEEVIVVPGEDTYTAYACVETEEVRTCDEFNEDGTNCLEHNVRTGESQEIVYKDGWQEVSLQDGELTPAEKGLVGSVADIFGLGVDRKEVPGYFEVKQSSEDEHLIGPSQTVYFEMVIGYPANSRGEFYIEAIGDGRTYGILDPWWSGSWSYRMPIVVDNQSNASDLTEYQIYVEMDDTASTTFWGHVQSAGGDVRFTNEAGDTELDYWIQYWDYASTTASMWVQVDQIASSSTSTIYMYYGNVGASAASDELATFSYSTSTDIFYVVSDQVAGNSVYVGSLDDNNTVQLDAQTPQILSRQGMATFGTVSQTSVLSVTKPVSTQLSGNGMDMLLPISYASTTLIAPTTRSTDSFQIYSPFGSTTVRIYDGVTLEQTNSVATGTVWNITNDIATMGIIEADPYPVLAYHHASPNDGWALYPATDEDLYGIHTGGFFVGIGSAGTNVTEYASDGNSASQTSQARGTLITDPVGSGGSEGSGEAIRVVASSSHYVGAIQQADSDGNESTAFWARKELGSQYIVTADAQYVAVACPVSTSSIEVNSTTTTVTSGSCSSSGVMPTYPGKVCLGDCSSDTLQFQSGYVVESTDGKPFYAIFEDRQNEANGDETNMIGAVQNRKYSWPHPTHTVGAQEESSLPRYYQNYFRWYANTDSVTVTDPWPAGGEDLVENTALTGPNAIDDGDILRLRMSINVENATSTVGSEIFKLQYVAAETCDLGGLGWVDVAAVGSTTAVWRGYDNASVADGATLPSTVLSVSDVSGSYEEENNSTTTPNQIGVGEDMEFDWVLENNGSPTNINYCFRVTFSSGSTLNGYNNYVEVATDGAPNQPTPTVLFDNEKTPDLTPALQFSTTDDGADDIEYQVQIDDDYLFGSPAADTDSETSPSNFSNLTLPSDKAPFYNGHNIQYTVGSDLASSTTYYWRVRGKDPQGSNQWGDWSNPPMSFTTDQNVQVTTWFQTTQEQFDTDSLSGVEAQATDDVRTGPIGEYGTTDLTDNEWTSVTLSRSFTDMVVVASPRYPGNQGGAVPRTARIRNKSGDTFELKVDNYAGNVTGTTTVDWIAMEAGNWTIDDGGTGLSVVAGTENVSGQFYRSGVLDGSGATLSFGSMFTGTPAVLHSISSNDDASWITSSVDDGSSIADPPTNTTARLWMQSSFDSNLHDPEDIDYIAFEQGHGTTTEGVTFDTQLSADIVVGAGTGEIAVPWSTPFTSVPEVYVTSMSAVDGSDGGFAINDTGTAVTATNFYASVDEDGPAADRGHTNEQVALIGFDSATGTIQGFSGVITSTGIDFDSATQGTKWGDVSWTDIETGGTILYQVEYYVNGQWALVPDTEIVGNSTGTTTGPINIQDLDTSEYNEIRVVATFNEISSTPILQDWTVTWSLGVSTPTMVTPFDNEKVNSLTPSFTFNTTDPQGDDLDYEVQWATTTDFLSAVSKRSDIDTTEFSNLTTPADTEPFNSGDTVQHTIQAGDSLTASTTYWWRVRAKDPVGEDAWSFWSSPIQSLTPDTNIIVSTWFQGSKEQFDTDVLSGVAADADDIIRIQTTVGEFGTVDLAPDTWTEVTLDSSFSNMVVAASPRYSTADTTAPNERRYPRVRNKSANTFEVKVYNTGFAAFTGTTTVDWLAMDAGAWNIEDGGAGTKVIAGTYADNSHVKCNAYSSTPGEAVTFTPSFDVGAVVVGMISSNNDSSWVAADFSDGATLANEPLPTGMGVYMGRGFLSCTHSPEDIDYISFDAGHGTTTAGVEFDAATSTDIVAGASAGGEALTYTNAFPSAPAVTIVQLLGMDGGNGGAAIRHTGSVSTASTLYVGIDEYGSADRGHTAEVVGAIAFENATGTLSRIVGGALSGTVESTAVTFSDGTGPKWGKVAWADTETGTSTIVYQVLYETASSTWELIPDSAIPGNSVGTSTAPIELGTIDFLTYTKLKVKGTLTCSTSGDCPEFDWWLVDWSEGITVSGDIKLYDQVSDYADGQTVRVAVNGVEQIGKTGLTSGGTYSINNVTVFPDDIVTTWVHGASNTNEATTFTKFDGIGDISGMDMYARHLAIGSNDNGTITNADLDLWDTDDNADIFHDVDDGSQDLTACTFGCADVEVIIRDKNTYRPDSLSSGNIDTHDIEVNGTFILDGNTINMDGSWDNNGILQSDTSTIVFDAQAGTETIDSTGATTSSFNSITLGQTLGAATWQLASAFDVNGNITIDYGTLDMNGSNAITIADDLTINASGAYTKGTATTTFDGSGTSVWSDNDATKQDMGIVAIDGNTKTIQLGAAVLATDIWIGGDDTLDASVASHALGVNGSWVNNNIFNARAGEVTFGAIIGGNTIDAGLSSFYDIDFDGVGGAWDFVQNATTTNDVTITNGVVTMPTGELAIGGAFANTGGSFTHSSGSIGFTSTGIDTIEHGGSLFYDMSFRGIGGAWSFIEANATVTNNVIISGGNPTLPSGTLSVGGSFTNSGATFTHNSGTVYFTSGASETITAGGANFYNMLFDGAGDWTFVDVSATASNDFEINTGTVTLPTNLLQVGGSYINSGSFVAATSTVRLLAGTLGHTINPGSSTFYNLDINGAGGWTVVGNATSTNDWSITSAAALTVQSGVSVEVGGAFTNLINGANTTWTGSTLYLNSSSTQSINTKASTGDTYGTFIVGADTDIDMWHSGGTSFSVDLSGSLYSMDHAGLDGDLYIWGDKTISSGNHHWSHATDFDGSDLSGGSERQVDVRFADSATTTITNATLSVVGAGTASTTIANQSTGTFGLTFLNASTTMSYYQVQDLWGGGIEFLGTTTVNSLAYGDLELGVNGGALMTVASSTIGVNDGMQIEQVRFATSTGISTGYNVVVSGTTTAQWWFRHHYGDIDGEFFDNDPSGSPGEIKWDDSGNTIDVSGIVYANTGGPIGNPPCDGSAQVVYLRVNGGAPYTASCDAGTGAYTISGVAFTGDVVFTTYLNTNGGARASTVTKTPSVDITDMHLFEDRLIVRHEDADPIDIADLDTYDSAGDSDIAFTATQGSPSTLVLDSNTELLIHAGDTFIPDGNITLNSGGTGTAWDGSIHLDDNSTFTALGSESHSIGGNWRADAGAIFIASTSIVTFTATTSGHTIIPNSPFYNTTFNGSGGEWSVSSSTIVQNNLTMTTGTLVGASDVTVQNGTVAGAGSIAMTGGTFSAQGSGSFGGGSDWTFYNLSFGNGATTATSTKVGSSTVTINGVLTITNSAILEAASSTWNLAGSSTPFVNNGFFNADTSLVKYSGTGDTNITSTDYYNVLLAASSGNPTYTFQGGVVNVLNNISVGDGTNGVSITADANDPTISVVGDVDIRVNATTTASNSSVLSVGGSWLNNGVFEGSNGEVLFNSTDTGETIEAGNSSFGEVTFNNTQGGWTVIGNATSTGHWSLTNAYDFTASSTSVIEVEGNFTNGLNATSTTWTGATLYLTSGYSYSMNTKTNGGDVYDTLRVGAGTQARMWDSSAISYDVLGSLYSQDHSGVDGDVYIWGAYTRNSGSDYWNYETDFDGADLSGGNERQVDVRLADSSSVTITGGSLHMVGSSTASTTVDNQGSGDYGITINGGNINATYYQMRNMDVDGLEIIGTSAVTELEYGDFEMSADGGSMIKTTGVVINNNPLITFLGMRFATSTGVSTGYNVSVSGGSFSSWRMNQHYGNYDGESLDNDPGGNPGYVIWDDSDALVTISGNVYSDEGVTVSPTCDGSTTNVRVRVGDGTTARHTASTTCNGGTGFYQFTNVGFAAGDVITVWFDTNGGAQATNVSVDPITNIADMHLYENRLIVRHEDINAIGNADLAIWDSSDDSDILYTAGTDLSMGPDTKLIIWDNKTYIPGGNVTLTSGGSGNAWDGSIEIGTSSTFNAAGTQTYSIGGSWITNSGSSFIPANSTVNFTATTSGKTVTAGGSDFYNLTFSGSGGAWAIQDTNATSTNNVTISAGTATLPSGVFVVGGSFDNTGGVFTHNGGTVKFNSTAAGNTIQTNASNFSSLVFDGVGGAWTMQDTNATSTNDIAIVNGAATLPSGVLEVGGSFDNTGGSFIHSSGTIKLTSTASGETIEGGGSDFGALHFAGTGEWTFQDMHATTTGDVDIDTGNVVFPTGHTALGGSLVNNGSFSHSIGTIRFNAASAGHTVDVSTSTFFNVAFDNASGGWTVDGNATSTNNWKITSAQNFTLSSGSTLAVYGDFENLAGSATTWTGTTLYLGSGGAFTTSAKITGTEVYNILTVASTTDVRMWNSSATTYNVAPEASLYSMDHAGLNGDVYIWGDYERSTGADYWNYTTDFDGTALFGAGRRLVDVRIAGGATTTISGGTLEIRGAAGATTTIANQGSGTFSFEVSGGTFNAEYYQVRNTNANGLYFTNAPTISSISYGDFELGVTGGSMITVASTSIDANAAKVILGNRFATSTGVSSGYTITRLGTSTSAWSFNTHYGNYDGEDYDFDGWDGCGLIRWSDSSCLEISQEHYRWRNDDGSEAVPSGEWYDTDWERRKRVTLTENSGGILTDFQVKLEITYDSDMQPDFDDLRFTDGSGTTTLDYWIEDYAASASSTVWVKVPSLAASDTTDIYMYYKNSAVSTTGSGPNTFIWFDDFEDGNVTEYSGDISMFNVGTTFNKTHTYGLDASGSETLQTTDGIYRTDITVSQGETLRFFQYVDTSTGSGDEPCTLFGVQAPGSNNQNYAVCLDLFGTDQVVIAKDVSSNDGSGTNLSSKNVTFSTGWYEVEIDWLTDDSIDVSVYDSSSSLFATTTASDSSYSSGGIGFSFWYMATGWDQYTSREYVSSDPTVAIHEEQLNSGATWKKDEDTVANVGASENIRLRLQIINSGPLQTGLNLRAQIANKTGYGSCEAVPYGNYSDVPTTAGGCGTSAACMTASTNFSNRASTTQLLSIPDGVPFTPGQIMENPSNETSNMNFVQDAYLELEYNFQMTAYATSSAYCFRAADGGDDLDNYARVAELTMVHSPVISNFGFNGEQSIFLTEGTTTQILATGTVSDLNGYGDILYATSSIYRSGVGVSCADDLNNCYQIASSSCLLSSCSGTSCDLTCTANLEYFSEPTDIGAYSAEDWEAVITVVDTTSQIDTTTPLGETLFTLHAIGIAQDIDYGILDVGDDTGGTNATTTLQNTGNDNIDIELAGTDLTYGMSSTINVANQKFATSTFTYSSCSICGFLSGTSTAYEIDLPKPTSTSTAIVDDIYWGIFVPSGVAGATHTGINTFIATFD